MALENLKSIFEDELKSLASAFENNRPNDINDSKIQFDKTIYGTYGVTGVNVSEPTLDTLLRGKIYSSGQFNPTHTESKLFISQDQSMTQFYKNETFDSRIPKNSRIQINNVKNYTGTIFSPSLDKVRGQTLTSDGMYRTDYSTAGSENDEFKPHSYIKNDKFKRPNYDIKVYTRGRGVALEDSGGWEALYNPNHTSKVDDRTKNPSKTFGHYRYGRRVSIDKLDIRQGKTFSRSAGLGLGKGEPYIVSSIPTSELDPVSGRTINLGGRSIPIVRALTDTLRITKFLSSPAGIAFMVKQNLYATPLQTNVVRGKDELKRVPQRFNTGYNPLSTLGSAAARLLGSGNQGGVPNILIRKDEPSKEFLAGLIPGFDGIFAPREYSKSTVKQITGLEPLDDTFTRAVPQDAVSGFRFSDFIDNFTGQSKVKKSIPYGDKMTLSYMFKGPRLATSNNDLSVVDENGNYIVGDRGTAQSQAINPELEKNGMPFYFKDLRDNTYVFLRAYLTGITENLSPSWSTTNYIGRSEPTYVYERTERDLAFTLRLVAQTETELDKIYAKLNRITSMCYPQYAEDKTLGMNRMKPPLTKLRMGNLYGKLNKEVLGFIKTLTWVVPDETTWETKEGKKVPKFIEANFGYQVIHEKVPQLGGKYYGFNGSNKPHTEASSTWSPVDELSDIFSV